MAEHPILFSGEMVRAILDGRKTQTRRVIHDHVGKKKTLLLEAPIPMTNPADGWVFLTERDPNHGCVAKCRYGMPGNILWVREGIQCFHNGNGVPDTAQYVADYTPVLYAGTGQGWCGRAVWQWKVGKLSPRYMPRWARRITLEIVRVRVERVQDISDGDVSAEGVNWSSMQLGNKYGSPARDAYAFLWDNLNAKRGYGWMQNPYVWVIEFKRIEDAR